MIPTVERRSGCALAATTRITTLCTAALASVIIAWPSLSEAGFGLTASMYFARVGHTATLLPSGLVLVAGGFGRSTVLVSAELYDPASNTWSFVGSMATARADHTATLLPSGQVLVAGWVGGAGGTGAGGGLCGRCGDISVA